MVIRFFSFELPTYNMWSSVIYFIVTNCSDIPQWSSLFFYFIVLASKMDRPLSEVAFVVWPTEAEEFIFYDESGDLFEVEFVDDDGN